MDKENIPNKTNELKKIIKSKIYLISTTQKKGLEDLKKSLIANVYK